MCDVYLDVILHLASAFKAQKLTLNAAAKHSRHSRIFRQHKVQQSRPSAQGGNRNSRANRRERSGPGTPQGAAEKSIERNRLCQARSRQERTGRCLFAYTSLRRTSGGSHDSTLLLQKAFTRGLRSSEAQLFLLCCAECGVATRLAQCRKSSSRAKPS